MNFAAIRSRWLPGVGAFAVATFFVVAPMFSAPLEAQSGPNASPGVAVPYDQFSRPVPGVQAVAGNSLIDDSVTFNPITPCRIFDTRSSTGGAIANNATRDAVVFGTVGVSEQGGVDCGLPNRTRAVHINITAVPVTAGAADGFLTVYPYSQPRPNASALNFVVGRTTANALTVPICFQCASDLTIFNAFGTTHVIIDILGYYESPFVAEVNGDGTVASGTIGTSSTRVPGFPAGAYQVNFPRNVSDCAATVSASSAINVSPAVVIVGVADRTGVASAKYVQVTNSAGSLVDAGFTIRLDC